MCNFSKQNNHAGVKKIDSNGSVVFNVDYGVGYTICWENNPYSQELKSNRCGAYLQDILCRCVQQSDFLQKSTNNEIYSQVQQKLIEALQILQNNSIKE